MATKRIVPRTDADFNLFQANLLAILQPNIAIWGILPADFTTLTTSQSPWTTAFAKASNKQNRTSADVQAKDDARHAYEKTLRNFVAQWLARNPKVPDSERERMGLTVRDTKRTLAAAIALGHPTASVNFSVRLQHTIHFTDANSSNKAKPEGVHGCEIWCKIGDPMPKDATELTYLATDTRTPYIATFTGAEAGKTVHYWLRWVNNNGKPGPWSSLVSAMVVG